MMRLLYTLGIRCYAAGVRVAALGGGKAAKMVEGWKRTFGRLSVAPVGKEKTAWFHASSLGEFEQARPVLEGFREMHPDYKICVTFFSPSGYEVRKDYDKADFVSYLPMDTPANAARFVNLLHPTVVFFAKYDFWFNYLEQLHRREIPTYIFSAIFRPKQYFFKWYGVWFLKHLQRSFTHLFVQNDESVALLQAHGVPQVTKAGDTRFFDVDGNHLINNDDRVVIGDPNPDIYGNIFTRLTWKHLSLQAVVNYSLGNDVFNYQRSLLEGGSLFVNQTTAMQNRWTTEGQVTDIPRASYLDTMGNSRFSDRFIEDGSYLRLSNITLSYHLPMHSTYLQGITVWASADNLFTVTRYLGSNPDCSIAGSVLTQGIDRGLLSTGRSFSVGLNINL